MQQEAGFGESGTRHLHGREDELTELADLVVAHPLVTVAGPGGVGKSSLADAVVTRVEPVFADGVLVVRLAEVRAGAVLDAVSSAVELPRTGGGDRAVALTRWLRPRRALLVIDNCEHVLEEVLQILAPLLDDPSGAGEASLHLLTTSRRRLGLPLEQVVPVLPLALPAPDDPPGVVAATPSVALFLERARSRDRGFLIPDEQWTAVGEVCRRLDGLPLALELAAGRASALGLPRLLARLQTDLGVVSQQHLDGSGRLRSIEAVYDWSERLLSERERALLHGLSVFTGSFDIAAVDAVLGTTGAIGEWDDALTVLIETSLVIRDHRHDRYRLLETVRQLASERWDSDQARIRRRHAEHYLAAAIRAGEGFKSGPERDWLEGLVPEEPNLRTALEHALRRGSADEDLALQGLVAAANLPLYWWTRGQHREGFDWLRSALDTTGEAAPAELRAAALFGMAFLWAHDGDDWPTAAAYLHDAIDLLGGPEAEPGPTPILGYLLCLLGEAHAFADEIEQAVTLARRGRSLIARYPDPWGQAFAEWNVGFAHQCAGELVTAEQHYREMVRIQTEHGSRLELMIGHNSLAELAELRGEHRAARDHYAQGLDLRRNLGAIRLGYAHGSLPHSLLALARVSRALGEMDTARTYAQDGQAAAAQMQDEQTVAACAQELQLLSAGPKRATLHRQGTGWVVELGDESTVLADSKGLRHLHTLVTRPEQPIAATTLAGLVDGAQRPSGDAGPILDRQAVAAYRARLTTLDTEIDEATQDGNESRLRTAQDEREALIAELARGTGLGGRLRADKSDAERARINVTRTVRDAIERIDTHCPRLAEHLRSSVKTGTWCAYNPTTPVSWATRETDSAH